MKKVDVLIATKLKRRTSALSMIKAALYQQGIETRVTLALPGAVPPDFLAEFSSKELERLRFVENTPAGICGNAAWIDTLLNRGLDWYNWIYNTGDDDVLFWYSLQKLLEDADYCDMVYGQIYSIEYPNFHHATQLLGQDHLPYRISGVCCAFRTKALKKVLQSGWDTQTIFPADCTDQWIISEFVKDYIIKKKQLLLGSVIIGTGKQGE